ncbi:MAG: NAD(P)-dependent oxidoreductase [Clostridiales bacterium]|nr:NAD(P)-dependent oxidoreductase [Clostridiales bacterium]
MRIGFIGFGEAAYNIALGLHAEGAFEFRAYDTAIHAEGFGRQIQNRAEQAGVLLADSSREIAQWADLLFAAVPSTYTLNVCKEVLPCLREGQLYVDVSASTPSVKKAIWDEVKRAGVLFVDAAMLGSLPKDKHRVPITASGNGAQAFYDVMTPYGMQITCAGEEAGAASAIKLVRSIFMKGIAALMIETMQAADAYGVAEEIIASLSESLDGIPFASHLNRLVTGTAIHCVRRAKELAGSIDMLQEAGIASDMTAAGKKRTEALAAYDFAQQYAQSQPKGWQEIITALRVSDRKE